MGNSRTLRRKLDDEAIARVAKGIKHPVQTAKKIKKPRTAYSYRGARRNQVRERRADELAYKRRLTGITPLTPPSQG